LIADEVIVNLRHKIDICLGVLAIFAALFEKEFSPLGWTTHLIWGGGEDPRIPRPLAAAFYFIVGVILLYWGILK
jgi:hypothetical protein